MGGGVTKKECGHTTSFRGRRLRADETGGTRTKDHRFCGDGGEGRHASRKQGSVKVGDWSQEKRINKKCSLYMAHKQVKWAGVHPAKKTR